MGAGDPTAAARTRTLRLTPDAQAHRSPFHGAGAGSAPGASAVLGRRARGARLAAAEDLLVPRGVGGLLDTAFDVLVARFGPCWGSAFLLWLPAQFGLFLLIRAGAFGMQVFWQIVIAFLVQTFSLLFIARIVGGHMQGRRVGAGEAFLHSMRCLPAMAFVGGFVAVLEAFGTCACLVPGFAVSWLFSVVPVVYALERVGIGEALSRGLGLVTTGSSFVLWMGWFAVSSVLVFPFTMAVSGFQDPTVIAEIEQAISVRGTALDLLLSMVGALFLAFTTAYTAVLRTVYYHDCRVRAEGLDLELWLDRRAPERGAW